jgi:hypothetical protein
MDWENDPYVKKIRKLEKIAKENGIRKAVWSMNIKPWDTVAYKGKFKLLDPSAKFYGEGCGDQYVLVENPTWMDLWKACDQYMGMVDYVDHCFVEGFRKNKGKLEVFFGS